MNIIGNWNRISVIRFNNCAENLLLEFGKVIHIIFCAIPLRLHPFLLLPIGRQEESNHRKKTNKPSEIRKHKAKLSFIAKIE